MRLRLRRLDESIVELGVSGTVFAEPDQSDPDIVDCSAFVALPGLVDAHAHLQANGVDEIVAAGSPDLGTMATNAQAQIQAGVLLIADKGSKSNASLEFLASDPRQRPELEMAGAILVVEHGYYSGFGRVIDPAQAAEAASEAAATPATWVKFIGDWPRRGVGPVPSFDEDQLAAAVVAAHRAQARVAVHTMAPGTATAAVRAGVDSIEHGLFLTRDDIDALGRRGGAWVPTVFAMEAAAESLRPGSSGRRLLHDGLDNVRELLPGAVAAGVRVLAGTDLALAHGEVATEVQKLAEYGMSPQDIVASTVFGGYDYLGASSRLAPGERADVVCLPADPRDDISALAHPRFVMRLGRVVRAVGGPN